MMKSFKARTLGLVRWAVVVYALLFIFRLIYGYVASNSSTTGDFTEDHFQNISSLRKNYASEKISYKSAPDVQQQPDMDAASQKYEKTASVKISSSNFEDDSKRIAEQTKGFKAIVQYERALGLKGSREIHLSIGVNPEAFDSFYLAIQKISNVKATQIIKVDKTNEFRQLNARKTSLKNTLTSLNELKANQGPVTDMIELHNKILDIENDLQNLGVELGNFDTENEFCTVKLSLYEGAPAQGISFIHRVKVAADWSIRFYAFVVFGAVCVLVGSFILLLIIDKLKVIGKVREKLAE